MKSSKAKTRREEGDSPAQTGVSLFAMSLAAAAFLPPLVFARGLEDAAALPKLLALAACALLLALGAARGAGARRTALDLPLLAAAAALLLSSARSVDPWGSLLGRHGHYALGALELGLYAAAALSAAWASDDDAPRVLARAALASGALLGLHALLQRAGLEPFAGFPEPPIGRSYATLATPVMLGAHLALLSPLPLALSRAGKPLDRALAWTAGPLVLCGLLLTQSRAAWLGAAAAVALWLLLEAKDRRRARIAVLLLGAAAAAAVVFLSQVKGRGFDDAVRVQVWKTAWTSFLERPLLGWGPESFIHALRLHKGEGLFALYGPVREQVHVHDDLLHALATTGLAGTAAYLALLGALALAARRRRLSASPERRPLVGAMAAGLLGLFVQLKFDPCSSATLLLAALFAGLLCARPKDEAGPTGRRLLALPLALACAGALILCSRLALADASYRAAHAAQASGRVEAASAAYERALRLNPWEGQYRWDYCMHLYGLARSFTDRSRRLPLLERIRRAADGAAAARPNDSRALELKAYALLWSAAEGDSSLALEAERLLDRAAELEPTFVPALRVRLQLALRRKDAAKAEALAKEYERLSGPSRYDLGKR
ncbi:MAG: O-antigen ligase family protein [Elusimicrobiota bacterium]|jgi:O-antigen ligase